MPTSKLGKVNAAWFKSVWSTQGFTQRKIAKTLGMKAPSLSLFLRGKRHLKLEEATILSETMGVPLQEVMAKAGVKAILLGSKETVPVEGSIDGNLEVHFGAPKGPRTATRPTAGTGELAALRFQTTGTPLAVVDGACVYYSPAPKASAKTVPPKLELMGKHAIVKCEGGKKWFLRVCNRGYDAGTWNLHHMNGTLMEESATIEAALPVVWLRF